jgi:hypothetical protein
LPDRGINPPTYVGGLRIGPVAATVRRRSWQTPADQSAGLRRRLRFGVSPLGRSVRLGAFVFLEVRIQR